MSPGDRDARLLRMVNQIAANLGGGADSVAAGDRTAAHLRRFWSARMIERLLQLAVEHEGGLSAAARRAVRVLVASGADAASG